MNYAQLNRKKKKIVIDSDEKTETQHKLFNVNTRFPGKPYGPQLSMMSFIIQAVTLRKNALLESPTGTGKTLALLCGSLAALESLPPAEGPPYRLFYCVRTHSQLSQVVSELAKTSYRARMVVLGARVRYCLNETAKSSSNIQHACSELRNSNDCLYYNKLVENNMAFEFPEQDDDVWQLEHLKEYGESSCMCPYFMTSMLADRAELIICPYQYVLNPRIGKLPLSHNDILLFDEAHNMEDASRDAFTRCLTYVSLHAALADMFSLFSQFPAFIVRYGLAFYIAYCFIQWIMHAEAADDKMLYMNTMRAQLKIYSLTDIEVVNKLGGVIQAIKLDRNALRKAETNVREDGERMMEILESNPAAECKETFPIQWRRLNNMLEFERYNCTEGRFEVNDYFLSHTLDDPQVTVMTPVHLHHRSQGTLNMGTTETLKELGSMLLVALNEEFDNAVRVSIKAAESNARHKVIEMFTLEPALVFRPLAESVRCVILASGTLSPFTSFESELGVSFGIRMEGRHVINPEKQVCAMTVAYSASNYALRCVYQETSNERYQDELGETIYALVRCIPQGVLCFLPSYTLMKTLRYRWTSSGLWKKLGAIKELFCEPQVATEFNNTIERYYDACLKPKGALMFGIFRGKCSEGMDFTDHKARAVLSVGIPLPNFKDPLIDEKRRYNTTMSVKLPEDKRIDGSEWYSLQAWRAVNQALGRCIRHVNDYGCMILIDGRFQDTKKSTSSDCMMVSRWIRDHLVHESSLASAETKLREFFMGKK